LIYSRKRFGKNFVSYNIPQHVLLVYRINPPASWLDGWLDGWMAGRPFHILILIASFNDEVNALTYQRRCVLMCPAPSSRITASSFFRPCQPRPGGHFDGYIILQLKVP
jgi:hypothetical protein